MIDLLIPRFDPEHPLSAVENMAILGNKSAAGAFAFLHDDVDLPEPMFTLGRVAQFFQDHPKCGMVGFGGALGLGTNDIYKRPYDLMQLARLDFVSNMKDAELHGRRVLEPTRVSVLDGFCQIIRRTAYEDVGGWKAVLDMGIEFHQYDFAMACLMARHGWEVWVLPVPCHHAGGKTSCSPEYDAWLRGRGINGDAEIHRKAHEICYREFRDVLPLRIKGGDQ